MAKSKKKTEWFARGGGIQQCGPFKSQELATKAMRLVGSTDEEPRFPDDVFVWPVTKKA